jgi:allophanate hydrolase subunit 1
MTDETSAAPVADSGLSITEEYDLDDERARAVRVRTLAELFAVPMVYGTDGETRLKDLAQVARYAGVDETTIAEAQTHAKTELVHGGATDGE